MTDELDQRLNRAAPVIAPHTESILLEIGRMSVEVVSSQREQRRRRRTAIAGGALVLTLAGGTAAAAVSTGWSPWADEPQAIYSFALPSGGSCELRVKTSPMSNAASADIPDSDAPEVEAAESYLASVDLESAIDVNEQIRKMAAADMFVAGASPDEKTYSAAFDAIGVLVNEELDRRGFPRVNMGGEGKCDGADWQ